MIKVNLAKRPTSKKSGASPFASAGPIMDSDAMDEFGSGEATGNRALIVKLVIILLGSIALFTYQQLNVPPLKSKLSKARQEMTRVKKKNSDNANVVQEIAGYEIQQTKLQGQINAIEAVKKDRLREVRVLDYIQREIPEKVWLSKMDLIDGRLLIAGYAMADNELTTFMEGLQRSVYLKDISLIRSTESPSPEFGILKKFEIAASMERAP